MILHSFTMGDVEDPYLYAASPIYEWQQTDMGKWVMAHVVEQPVFHCWPDHNTLGYRVVITGELEERDEIIFRLKYGYADSYHR
jgi:hypothetical protein